MKFFTYRENQPVTPLAAGLVSGLDSDFPQFSRKRHRQKSHFPIKIACETAEHWLRSPADSARISLTMGVDDDNAIQPRFSQGTTVETTLGADAIIHESSEEGGASVALASVNEFDQVPVSAKEAIEGDNFRRLYQLISREKNNLHLVFVAHNPGARSLLSIALEKGESRCLDYLMLQFLSGVLKAYNTTIIASLKKKLKSKPEGLYGSTLLEFRDQLSQYRLAVIKFSSIFDVKPKTLCEGGSSKNSHQNINHYFSQFVDSRGPASKRQLEKVFEVFSKEFDLEYYPDIDEMLKSYDYYLLINMLETQRIARVNIVTTENHYFNAVLSRDSDNSIRIDVLDRNGSFVITNDTYRLPDAPDQELLLSRFLKLAAQPKPRSRLSFAMELMSIQIKPDDMASRISQKAFKNGICHLGNHKAALRLILHIMFGEGLGKAYYKDFTFSMRVQTLQEYQGLDADFKKFLDEELITAKMVSWAENQVPIALWRGDRVALDILHSFLIEKKPTFSLSIDCKDVAQIPDII